MWWNPTSPHNVTTLLKLWIMASNHWTVWVFMSCDPRKQQIAAGWLSGTSSATGASLEPRFLTFSHLRCQLWVFRIFSLFYFNVDVWVSRKVEVKIRQKIFESQVHNWRIKSLSLITLRSSDCGRFFLLPGLRIQVFFSDIARKNSLQRQLLQTLSGMLVYFSEKTLLSRVFLSP